MARIFIGADYIRVSPHPALSQRERVKAETKTFYCRSEEKL